MLDGGSPCSSSGGHVKHHRVSRFASRDTDGQRVGSKNGFSSSLRCHELWGLRQNNADQAFLGDLLCIVPATKVCCLLGRKQYFVYC